MRIVAPHPIALVAALAAAALLTCALALSLGGLSQEPERPADAPSLRR